jgi:diacylglycerol kinase family enzyme
MSGRPFRWIIIANPKAGGFTMPYRWKRHYRFLRNCAERAKALPRRNNAISTSTALDEGKDSSLNGLGLIPTRYPGHAGKIVEILVKEAAAEISANLSGITPFYLIICAGGDGTSLEVLTTLYHAPAEIRANCVVLRLPMGTGNDGADARELGDALDLLLCPTRIELVRAVCLTTPTAGKGPFLAFNILSVGLDAFVTHMTNKMKGSLPGDSYKLWVDIASLLYDRLYKVGPLDIRVFGDGPEERTLRETVLLLAMGVSGHRTYGSNKLVLPDDRNVCLVRQMSLLRKLALKGLFSNGTHVDKPESLLFNARRVEFRGEYPILAQMDGETVLLHPEDFPAAIELTEPLIPVLKKQPHQQNAAR